MLWVALLVLALSLTALLPATQAGPLSTPRTLTSAPVSELSTPMAVRAPSAVAEMPIIPASDPALPQVLASVNVGSGPTLAVYDPATQEVYVVNAISNTVSVLNGTAVVATVPLGTTNFTVGDPVAAVYDPSSGYVYVVDRYLFEENGGAVSVIHGTTLLLVIPIGLEPSGAAYDASNGFLYVAESSTGHVAVIDGTGTIANLAVGTDPGAVIFDPADGMDYVANRASANLSVLSGVSVVGTVGVGTQPAAFAFDPLSGAVYVANNQSGNVTLVVGLSAVGDVTTGTNPSFALFEPSDGYVYVSNRNSSDVSLIDGTSVVTSVPTAAGPAGSAFNAATGLVYIVDTVSNEVTVLDGTVSLGNISVGNGPSSATWNSANADLYVTNSNSHNVSVIAAAYYVTFNESGLPPASPWSVDLGSKTSSTTGPSIRFANLPGTYVYTIVAPPGYHVVSATPTSPLTVFDVPVVVSVVFAPTKSSATYDLTFVETGLGSRCSRSSFEWSVTVGNSTQSSTNSTIVFVEPNGTYNYSVSGPSGYSVVSATPGSPVTIAGAPVTVHVTFSRCGEGGSSTFTLTFEERGLPGGTTWCVNMSGSHCSSSDQISISGLSSGTYSFAVVPVNGYTARPSSGSVTIYDRSITVEIRFDSSGSSHHCGGGGGGGGGGWGGGGGGWSSSQYDRAALARD